MNGLETSEFQKRYIPVKEYALKKGITVQAVYQRIWKGNLRYKKIGTYTLVEA